MKMIMNTSPHIRSKNSTRRIMLDVCIALTPALAVSVFRLPFAAFDSCVRRSLRRV